MKIAIFCPYNIFINGGVQEHVKYQAEILRNRGHEVAILTPRPRDKDFKDAPKGVVFLGTSARVKTPSATSNDVSIIIDNESLQKEIDKNYDIIHVHEPLIPVLARQLLTNSKGVSLRVGTFHAALPGNALGKSMVGSYKTYARAVLPHVDVVTAVSPAAIGFIDDFNKLPINYVPNGIHEATFKNKKSAKRNRNQIFFMGRLEKRKGALYAIKAFAELKSRKPEAQLLIAGDGPLKRSLMQYVARNDINDVVFLGFISVKDKVKYLSTCGVYTSPALYGESFGIVLAEAMSLGIPIVAHPNDGYSWVMKETGRLSLVNAKDSVAYADRLQLLLEDDALRAIWQDWAAEYVKQFDYEKVVDQYEALYRKYLK